MLIGQYEASKHLGIEAAICMRDKRPGYLKDARISLKRAFHQFRKLPVITRRKVGPDIADLIFREMKVIDQPLGRGRYRMLAGNCRRDDSIGVKQGVIVGANPFGKGPPAFRL